MRFGTILGLGFLVASTSFAVIATTQPAERTTASGLKIVDNLRADADLVAQDGDVVYVQYTGKLVDGKKFDSSYDRPDGRTGTGSALTFKLGKKQVIAGWEEGILGMRVGDQRTLTIPPELGYGQRGAGQTIPANATLIFDVKLVGIDRP
jgi:FKBP-type peptidyl-prolyl cis-trans isomerase